MRKLLARLIVAFAKFATIGFHNVRRIDVLMRVRNGLEREVKTELSVVLPHGARILFCDDTGSSFGIIRDCQLAEPDTAAWIDSIPQDGVLWDIGANIGFFTLYAASLLSRDGVRVVAFEPAAANYGALNRNIEWNAMGNHAVAYCVALAGTTRTGRLNMDVDGGGTDAGCFYNGFESEVRPFDRIITPQFRQSSVGFSIDDFVDMFQPPLPTHVKLDVDNIEAQILRGGRRTLSAHSVQSIILEMEGDLDSPRNRELFAVMAELGFAPLPKQSPELRNVIFERPRGA